MLLPFAGAQRCGQLWFDEPEMRNRPDKKLVGVARDECRGPIEFVDHPQQPAVVGYTLNVAEIKLPETRTIDLQIRTRRGPDKLRQVRSRDAPAGQLPIEDEQLRAR